MEGEVNVPCSLPVESILLMILSNQAECLNCGDKPFSATRHDYKFCECGNISVDGGMDYLHHSYKEKEAYKNISIEWDDILVKDMCLELEKMIQTRRNSLGLTCAVARILSDSGYEIKEIGDVD